jgi:TnpA family transposase
LAVRGLGRKPELTGGVTALRVLSFTSMANPGFAFVPRIPDLDGRCLYGFGSAKQYGILQNVMGDRIDADLIRAHWDDILRIMTSLRTRTVSASLMLKRLSATTRQNGLAQALRQMGRIERPSLPSTGSTTNNCANPRPSN